MFKASRLGDSADFSFVAAVVKVDWVREPVGERPTKIYGRNSPRLCCSSPRLNVSEYDSSIIMSNRPKVSSLYELSSGGVAMYPIIKSLMSTMGMGFLKIKNSLSEGIETGRNYLLVSGIN